MNKALTTLRETEMEVLHNVWKLGEASVADVREQIRKEREVAYTTIMTVMKNLEKKGYLKYRKEGASFIYSAARKPDEVRYNLVDKLVEKVFHGSPGDLVQTLVKSENLSAEERQQIRKIIDDMEA